MSTSPTRRFNGRSTAQDVVKGMDLKGKTIAITGTTSGIGIETTRALSMAGAHVVMFIRNVEAGKSLHRRIIDDHPDAQIDIIQCDLKSLTDVKRAAEEFISKGWPLHVLILNAGVAAVQDPDRTIDGYETTFAVNHLAQYYLCKFLLDVMLQSTPARVVVVSSESHRRGPGIPKDLKVDELTAELLTEPVTGAGPGMIPALTHYGKSKMCNVWFANALDRQYKDKGLRAVSLHPGSFIATGIAKDRLSRLVLWLGKPFSKSLSQGAATSVFCAVDPSIDTIADVGRYYMDCWYTPAHRLTDDVGLQLKLALLKADYSPVKHFCSSLIFAEKMSTSPTRRFNGRSTAQDVVKGMDLKGKTIAITGTTNGIGIETTRALSMAGAHVVMFIRNVEAGKSLHARIIDDYPEAKIDIIECDLNSLANVKRAAKKFLSKGWPLHVLILNAGVFGTQDPDRTIDGYETTFAVNHLAQYYLCKLLLDVMLQSTPARVVVVSSEGHHTGMPTNLQVDDLTSELLTDPARSASGIMNTLEHYGKSKMCNIWFANALDRQYKDKGLRAVSLNPGLVSTSLLRGAHERISYKTRVNHVSHEEFLSGGNSDIAKDWWTRLYLFLAKPIAKSMSQGAATSVFCAVDPSIDTIADVGRYYMDCWYTPAHRLTDDVGLQLKLGTISDMLIEKAVGKKK